MINSYLWLIIYFLVAGIIFVTLYIFEKIDSIWLSYINRFVFGTINQEFKQ